MILLSLRGGGTSNPLETRVWGSRNLEVKKFGSLVHHLSTKVFAFTMAELLIGMTIIGILAAIILPSVNANLNERLWKAQRMALFTKLQQAFAQMSGLNGYGSYVAEVQDNEGNVTTSGVDDSTAAFIIKGLATNLKINQICTVEYGASADDARKELKKCGINDKFRDQEGNTKDFPVTYNTAIRNGKHKGHVGAFQTANGDNVAVFYNPGAGSEYHYAVNKKLDNDVISTVFVYDLNGLDKPNEIGKDMGIFVAVFGSDPDFFALDPVYNTEGYNARYRNEVSVCKKLDKNSHIVSLNEAIAINATRNFFRNNGGFTGHQTRTWTRTSYDYDKSMRAIVWIDSWYALYVDGSDPNTNIYYTSCCNRSLFKKK